MSPLPTLSLSRLLTALSLFLFATSAWAAAQVKASVGLDGVRIEASIPVRSDARTLWATLTDYNNLAKFIPDLVLSRVVSPPNRPKLVEQKGDSGLFSFVMPDHVILSMEEFPVDRIRFHSVSGKVISMSGEWRIVGTGNPVRLTYSARVFPLVPPPPLVTDFFVEDEVRKRFEAVAREAERRAQTATPPPRRVWGWGPL
jgi:hypothetical protein